MSSRKRRKPRPVDPERLGAEYVCGHCTADTLVSTDPPPPVVFIGHDETCPTRTGAADPMPSLLRALDRAAS
ncbi:hypothetical protein O3Q52_16670 [Streptomyces sp. ActVer]|uniref:hypothetical protein n=1 Tax=Streptomyces sp. ActVer TaxID=3014558 RepID=UPI0022B4E8C3|nr:hypothetical protein [Streptomyces sp. ActVer]MCZ4509800.1 hypothetical protein [Streptomyces sp. ActVer]